MVNRSIVAVSGLFALLLVCTLSLSAQSIKTLNKEPINKQEMKPKIVDINSASEAEIAGVGIDKAVAKKIVEGRPYRNKRELVSRDLLTSEQYDKLKDRLVAKQPPKK